MIKFEVSKASTVCAARSGRLIIRDRPVNTPNILISTRRLCIPHLTPDILRRTVNLGEVAGVKVQLEALAEDNYVIPKNSPYSVAHLMGLGSDNVSIFMGADEHVYYREAVCSEGKVPTSTLRSGPDWVSLACNAGNVKLHLKESINTIVKSMKPDVLISPTDVYQWSTARLKRMKRSRESSARFYEILKEQNLEDCFLCPSVILHQKHAEPIEKESFIPIEMDERIDQVIKYNQKTIICVLCEDGMNDKLEKLQKSSPSSCFYIAGALTPKQIVNYFNLGADIFDSLHATNLADKGIMLQVTDMKDGNYEEVNLAEDIYFEDFSPLREDCGCIACEGPDKTTKAYVHHLLRTSEMLANVFLSSHNIWQLNNLIRSLSTSLS